ncbi:MAG: hypothetical protein QOF62_1601 [Pyrinomonadaceae bacterium]|nr:hypothetical protein [Pyrinomonadaceae bacterium]
MRTQPPLILEVPQDDLGGASGARRFYVLAVGKRNSEDYPYTVANEKIASELGRAIGLRIPEVVLHRLRDEYHAFAYYIIETESGETVPEGTAAEIADFYQANPADLHGMVCFDLFICNNDRKPDNLVIGKDKKVWLIDHANSLFYRPTGSVKPGIPRLIAVEHDLRAMFDKPHGFIKALHSWEYTDMWCARISQIPSHFIRSIIDNLPNGILNEEERGFLFEFLERRKKNMQNMIGRHRSIFAELGDRGVKDDE